MKLYHITFTPETPRYQYEVLAVETDREEAYKVIKIFKKHEKNSILSIGSLVPVTERTTVKCIGDVEDYPEYFI